VLPTYLDSPITYKPTSYDVFYTLYKNTYGFSPLYSTFDAAGVMWPSGRDELPDRLTRDTLPNSSRYYAIPILPNETATVPSGMTVLSLEQTRTDTQFQTALNTLYPADQYGTTAYAVEVDNSFFVLNSNENSDIDQYYKFKLGNSDIRFMEGNIGFQNILFGKREGVNNFWFQTNGYVGDGTITGQKYICRTIPSVITFTCDSQPAITVDDGKNNYMTIIKPWDEATKTITLSFDHTNGAVSFRIQAGISITSPNISYSDGTVITDLIDGKTITANYSITNLSKTQISSTAIIALYNEVACLKQIVISNYNNILQGTFNYPISVQMLLPNIEHGSYVKVLLVEGLSKLSPSYKPIILYNK
jgi:hypothetical protein